MEIKDVFNKKIKDYITLVPDYDYKMKEEIENSFKNVIYVKEKEDFKILKELVKYINDNNLNVIFFDFAMGYRQILPYIDFNKNTKFIYTHNLSEMTHWLPRGIFTYLIESSERRLIKLIGCLDESTYIVLKNAGFKVAKLSLNIKHNKDIKIPNSNSIGIIGDDSNPNHNVYNELSAISMCKYSKVKLISTQKATDHFIKYFNINAEKLNSKEEVMKNNFVNLFCNLNDDNIILILKSFDNGVPCILGNTNIFDKYPTLKKLLVLNSDDDINEIVDKINNIKNNKEIIFKEYKKFRLDYDKKSSKELKEFLDKRG